MYLAVKLNGKQEGFSQCTEQYHEIITGRKWKQLIGLGCDQLAPDIF
jgi:hypothetical protein